MQKKKGYGAFLALTITCTLAALLTLIPHAEAEKASWLGYRSLCTFTPVSTLICLALAGTSCRMRRKFFTAP